MRTNMKKALAVLMTLVMLCGLLPLGMLSASAATNLVSNGTFETDTSGWSTSSTITQDTSDPGSGSASLKLDCTTVDYAWTYVKVSVAANTDYVLTFKGKTANAGLMVNFQSNWTSIADQIPRYTVGSSSTWTDCSYEFNTGSYTSLMIYFQSSWTMGTGSYIWIDDVAVTAKETEPEPEVPSGENLIVNGSFEDGSNGWTLNTNGSVVSGGQEGDYALQMQDPATAYSGIAYQYVTVEPGKTYTLTWYAKRVSGTGIFNLYYDGATCNSGQNWMNETSGEWVKYTMELTINATTTSLLVKFSNEAANTSGTVLIDNVVLIKNPEASFDGYITNGDFEIGTMQGWNCSQTATASTAAAYSGNYGAHITNPAGNYGGMIYQNTVNVVAGKTYTISFWIKVTVGYVNFQIKDGGTSGTNLTTKGYNSNTWTQGSFTVTPTTNVLCINFCGGGTGTVDEAYVDDMLVVEEKDPSDDGYIYNGDFETGKTNPWTIYSSTATSAAAKYEGNFGLNMVGDGGWGAMAYQGIRNLKIGQQYTITMWMKVVTGGVNVQIKETTSSTTSWTSGYRATSNTGDWTQLTFTFTPTTTTGVINFCGDGTGTAASIYVDSITCGRVGGEIYPEELIRFGGDSIRDVEVSSTGGTGYGLAFKFDIEATGSQKSYENKYVESSGKITLDETEYDLISMGAVMTNQASVGQNSDSFTLDAVNGTKVIDIPAVYLAGVTDDSVSFAVRILDIPENHTGTFIYARPYYVYQENGQETIVYGDIQSNSYEKVSNPKSSIKILSIGSSFSKDIMVTYLYNMFKAGGYDEVVIGYLYMGGCSMVKHLYNAEHTLAQYEYGKNSNGTWVQTYDVSSLDALQDEQWDYVTIHGSSDYVGGNTISKITLGRDSELEEVDIEDTTDYAALAPLTEWVYDNALKSSVKVEFNMIWAYSQDCTLWSNIYHKDSSGNYSQSVMYNNIINQTRQNVLNNNDIDIFGIIPCGTAIQNGRSSFIGDNFNEDDGYHLNSKYGDYTGALTWYCFFSGEDASAMAGYTGDLSADEFEAVAEAVDNAINKPYEVTESTHT